MTQIYQCFAGGGNLEWGGLSVEAGSSFHRQWATVSFWAVWKYVCVFDLFKHLIKTSALVIHNYNVFMFLVQIEEVMGSLL